MAATVLSFSITSTPGATTTADHYAYFTPPASIAGKLCYVAATYFTWDYGSAMTPTLGSKDAFQVTCDWVQPYSVTTTDSGSKLGAPLAYQNNNFCYFTGPVLCRIPDNPHVVRFQVSRPDGDNINGSSGTCYMVLSLKVVVADGRQPPLGV
jgi:hypothetical protein